MAKLAAGAGVRSVGGGCRVIFTETVLARQVAVMTTGVLVVTCRVVISKLTSWPAAVTLDGTDAAGELLARLTTLPLGAFPLNSSVLTTSVPPEKKLGTDEPSTFWLDSMNTWLRRAGSTVNGAVTAWPPSVALRVSAARRATCNGSIVKLACVCPAGIGIDCGTAAAFGLLLARVIVAPPVGAGVVSCTIPNASLSSLVPLKTWVWLRNTTPPSVKTSMVSLFSFGGVFETVKLRADDHAVTAALWRPASPWKLRTRQ